MALSLTAESEKLDNRIVEAGKIAYLRHEGTAGVMNRCEEFGEHITVVQAFEALCLADDEFGVAS